MSTITAKYAAIAAAVRADPHTIREGQALIQKPPKKDTAASGSTASASTSAQDADAMVEGSNDGGDAAAAAGEEGGEGQAVFYNKVQVFNRDLSILMCQTFVEERKKEFAARQAKAEARRVAHEAAVAEAKARGVPPPAEPANNNGYVAPETFPGITMLEALSATGLRSIRYFKEIGDVASIVVNDMDAEAVRSIEHNIRLNGLTTEQLIPSCSDAITLMQKYRPPPMGPIKTPRPSVIDLDPYGTAAPFLDSAVQAIDEGGMLAVTCTDKSILCGNYSETCWAKYGSMPLRGDFCHETAIRLVLYSISSACNRYGRYIVPMLSMSIDFYIRVFVRVYTSAQIVKKQAALTGMILECTGCQSFWPHAMGRWKVEGATPKHSANVVDAPLTPGCKCPECEGSIKMGGPFWLGPLHHKPFVNRALEKATEKPELFATSTRIIGSLTVCSEELQGAEEAKMENRESMYQKRVALQAAHAANTSSGAAAAPAAAATASSTSAGTAAEPAQPAAKKELTSSLLYYSGPHLFQAVNSSCPKISILRSAILNAGYEFSQTHCMHNGIKTNAPPSVMWDLIRCWARDNPPKNGQKAGSVGERIMARQPRLEANWKIVKGTDLSSTATGVAKFLPNPEEHWGPKARAGTKRKAGMPDDQQKRAKLNQNKRSRTRQCKAFAETGTCKFGDNCKYAHVVGAKAGEDVSDCIKDLGADGQTAAASATDAMQDK